MSNIKKLSTVFAGVLVCFVVTPLMAEPEVVRYSRYPESKPVNNNGVVAASVCNNLSRDWPSPFTNEVCWSDGSLPHKGVVYAAGKIDNADSVLWTPIQSTNTTYDMFDALVLETGCTLCIRHDSQKKAIFNNLRIAGEASIYGPDVDNTVLGGENCMLIAVRSWAYVPIMATVSQLNLKYQGAETFCLTYKAEQAP